MGDDLLVCLEHSPYIRAQEQGRYAPLDELEPGHAIHPPEVLFAKIADEQIAEWKARFGGVTA